MARKGNPILVILELELLILLVGFTITLFFLWLGIPIVPIACCDDGDGQTDSPPDDVVDMGAPRSPPTDGYFGFWAWVVSKNY